MPTPAAHTVHLSTLAFDMNHRTETPRGGGEARGRPAWSRYWKTPLSCCPHHHFPAAGPSARVSSAAGAAEALEDNASPKSLEINAVLVYNACIAAQFVESMGGYTRRCASELDVSDRVWWFRPSGRETVLIEIVADLELDAECAGRG